MENGYLAKPDRALAYGKVTTTSAAPGAGGDGR